MHSNQAYDDVRYINQPADELAASLLREVIDEEEEAYRSIKAMCAIHHTEY